MLNYITRTPVLISTFVATILLTLAFGAIGPNTGGPLLDLLPDSDAALGRLAEMSAQQKDTHFWVTVLMDTAYPVAYGAFLGGLAARFAGRFRILAVMPALATMIVDMAENTVQAMALAGNTSPLELKDILTPAKVGLFQAAALLALLLALVALVRWIIGKLQKA